MSCAICDQVGVSLVECVVCGLPKKPIGRCPPLEMANGLCDHECDGYGQEPLAQSLWPGERYGDSMGHADWHEQRDPPVAPRADTGTKREDTTR